MPLPVELITEILLRLPAKSLLRFKIVCKLWYNLIKSTDFVNLHLERSIAAQTNLHFVYKTPILHLGDFDTFDNSIPLECPFKEGNVDVAVVGSCNGLLCLRSWVVNDSNESNNPLLIYNPTTQTYTTPPLLPTSSLLSQLIFYYGFGYESITQDYRCVCIIKGFNMSFEYDVMIYSLKEGSWRKPAIPSVFYDINEYTTKSVFLNDAVHWGCGVRDSKEPLPIVAFNLRDECFITLPVPNLDFMDVNISMFVGVLDGNLCLAVSDMFFDTYTDLWVMKEYGTAESWVKLFSIAKFNGTFAVPVAVARPIGYSMSKKELFVHTDLLQVASFDLDTREISYVKSANFSRCTDAHVCVENLLMLRG